MNDQAHLEGLLGCRYPLITIPTYEEDYALTTVRAAAVNRGLEVWQWSINGGLRDGLVAGSASLIDGTR